MCSTGSFRITNIRFCFGIRSFHTRFFPLLFPALSYVDSFRFEFTCLRWFLVVVVVIVIIHSLVCILMHFSLWPFVWLLNIKTNTINARAIKYKYTVHTVALAHSICNRQNTRSRIAFLFSLTLPIIGIALFLLLLLFFLSLNQMKIRIHRLFSCSLLECDIILLPILTCWWCVGIIFLSSFVRLRCAIISWNESAEIHSESRRKPTCYRTNDELMYFMERKKLKEEN